MGMRAGEAVGSAGGAAVAPVPKILKIGMSVAISLVPMFEFKCLRPIDALVRGDEL